MIPKGKRTPTSGARPSKLRVPSRAECMYPPLISQPSRTTILDTVPDQDLSEKQLLLKRNEYPLWVPQPSGTLVTRPLLTNSSQVLSPSTLTCLTGTLCTMRNTLISVYPDRDLEYKILVWPPINIYFRAEFWVVGNTHIELNEDLGRSRNCSVEESKPKGNGTAPNHLRLYSIRRGGYILKIQDNGGFLEIRRRRTAAGGRRLNQSQ